MSQPMPIPDILIEAKNANGESRTEDAVALLNEAIFQLHLDVQLLGAKVREHTNGHGRGAK